MNSSYLGSKMSYRTKQNKCIKIIVAFSLNSYVGQQQHIEYFDANATGKQQQRRRQRQ